MLAVKTPAYFSFSSLKISSTERQFAAVFIPCQEFSRKYFSLETRHNGHRHLQRSADQAILAVVPDVNEDEILSSSSTDDDFIFTTSPVDEDDKLKVSVCVSGMKTQEIYDEVFSKMVAEAQPIPGFRRVKGGKTPNIPKHIILEVLGPSNVNVRVINKIISSAISEYVTKEELTISEDLRIEQSIDHLLAALESGSRFTFEAVVQCQESK